MKKFKEFKSNQQYITETGVISTTIGIALGGIAAYKGGQKFWNWFKGWRESQSEKKANMEYGVEIEVKKIHPETGEEYEELVPLSGKDAKLDAEGVEKKRKELQSKYNNLEKGKDKSKAAENIRAALGKGPGDIITKDDYREGQKRIKAKLNPPEPEEPTANTATANTATTSTPPPPEDQDDDPVGDGETDAKAAEKEPEDEPKGNIPRDFVGKEIDQIPDDMKEPVQALERKKLKGTKDVEAHMKRWGLERVVGWSKKKGSSGMSSDYEYVKNSRIISFGEFIAEDIMKDLKDVIKSKKDTEISLDDGADIPIDPMTAEIFVKYIEGKKSSEQKKIINQIQRTERGFMKVLGKAHGE